MHPEKESGHILMRFVAEWLVNEYGDGWALSVTWNRDLGEWGSWVLVAEKPTNDHGRSRVEGIVSRDEWTERHHAVVDEKAEQMYLDQFVGA